MPFLCRSSSLSPPSPSLILRTLQNPVRASERLVKKVSSLVNFANIPITESECSRVLRLATVQHLIFNVICESLWNPFFSTHLWQHNRERLALIEIYPKLAAYGENVQWNWKVSMLKVLDKLDEKVNVREMIDDLVAENITGFLSPLLKDNQDDQFRSELALVYSMKNQCSNSLSLQHGTRLFHIVCGTSSTIFDSRAG
jgi:hypothetical protein